MEFANILNLIIYTRRNKNFNTMSSKLSACGLTVSSLFMRGESNKKAVFRKSPFIFKVKRQIFMD